VPELMFADSPRAASFSHKVWIICDFLSKNFKDRFFMQNSGSILYFVFEYEVERHAQHFAVQACVFVRQAGAWERG